MIDMGEVLQTFIAESQELLQQMEQALLDIEQNPDDPDTLNAIFRAAHTIKGSAGLFGFDLIVAFTHVAESVLDRARSGELPIDGALSALLLEAGDHLTGLIAQLDAGASLEALPPGIITRGEALIGRMGQYLEASPGEARDEPATSASATASEAEAETGRDEGHWHLSLRFGPDTLRNGMDPLAFFRYLNTFGRILQVEALTERLPSAAEMDPETCYLGFELAFASDADKATIEGAFEFVREDSLVQVLSPAASPDALRAHLDALPEDPADAGERLLRCASVSRAELDAVLAPVTAMTEAPAVVAQTTLMKAPVDGPVPAAKLRGDNSLIRVDAGKLDQLINLIGELIIAGAGARMIAQNSGLGAMVEATEVLSRLVEEVRDSALTLAIIDGFLIGVGQASYVVPLDMVEECIELPPGHLDGRDYLELRGDVLPFIRLRQLFDEASTPPRRENVVVVRYAGTRAGLVVDQLLGEFQTVIKPLGKVFHQVSGLSGFTILGSGDVALILDIPGLLGHIPRTPNDLRQASPVATLT
ncbi:chemotaxis protein CheA [Pseudomonas sp. NPDC077382]